MTAVTAGWILSVLGALSFFVAGWLVARRRSAGAATPVRELADLEDALTAERERARVTVEQLEGALAAEKTRATGAELAVVAERARVERVLRDRDANHSELLAVRRQLEVGRHEAPVRRRAITAVGPDGLRGLVERVCQLRSIHAAVVADEQGLVVASAGDHGDALAAMGRHLANEGQRLRDLLPIAEVQEVFVRDDHDVTVTIRPLQEQGHDLALITLGIGAQDLSSVLGARAS